MNERIRELAEQQGLTGPNYLISSQELEKFAVSIVRECATIADKAEPYKSNDLILKHFGVE